MVKITTTIFTSIILYFLTISLIIPIPHIFALEDFTADFVSIEHPHPSQFAPTTEVSSNDGAQTTSTSDSLTQKGDEPNNNGISSPNSEHMANHYTMSNGRHLSQQSEQTAKDSSNIDSTPPGRVGMVIVEVVSSNQIDLKWTGVKDSDLSHYNIYMGTKSSFRVIPGVTEPTGTSTTNSYSSTGLKPSTKYYYKIAAVDDSGNAAPLSTMYAITHAASTQGDDQSVKATASTQSDDNSVKATASTQSDDNS